MIDVRATDWSLSRDTGDQVDFMTGVRSEIIQDVSEELQDILIR